MSTIVDDDPALSEVDPRIQARRDAVTQAQQRRSRRWRSAILITLVVTASAFLLTRTALMDVDRIEFRDSEHTTDEALLAASAVAVGDQVLDVDEDSVEDRLRGLPWIADADVSVSWRGTMNVDITERQPIAMVTDADGRPVLVDAESRVLAAAVAPDLALVPIDGIVAGAPGQVLPTPAADALAVVEALTPSLRSRVELLTIDPTGSIELTVRPSGRVRFCGVDALDAKIRSLQTVFAQVDDGGLARIDVCIPEQTIVERGG